MKKPNASAMPRSVTHSPSTRSARVALRSSEQSSSSVTGSETPRDLWGRSCSAAPSSLASPCTPIVQEGTPAAVETPALKPAEKIIVVKTEDQTTARRAAAVIASEDGKKGRQSKKARKAVSGAKDTAESRVVAALDSPDAGTPKAETSKKATQRPEGGTAPAVPPEDGGKPKKKPEKEPMKEPMQEPMQEPMRETKKEPKKEPKKLTVAFVPVASPVLDAACPAGPPAKSKRRKRRRRQPIKRPSELPLLRLPKTFMSVVRN
ncbi:uncharacterized protein [Dermacentor andersoni]|uniref:uncharacterized protein n=1 Tax=Dermacentor andersoni TaxID=34620 RepID=UPI003B3AE88F